MERNNITRYKSYYEGKKAECPLGLIWWMEGYCIRKSGSLI